MENRLDIELVRRGLYPSRERAQDAVKAGLVTVGGRPCLKCAAKVTEADELIVTGELHPYVSRGGLKLEGALDRFGISPDGEICIDVGASTGGFTDVLLRRGAKRVYAVDVGRGQLDPSLEADARVVSMEQTNARTLTPEMFDPRPTLAVMDVSFIAIELILPALFDTLGANGRLISLIKPQFEAGKKALGKNGVVTDAKAHREVLERLTAFVPAMGWTLQNIMISPIRGTEGNLEFLGDFVPLAKATRTAWTQKEIRGLVESGHKAMKREG